MHVFFQVRGQHLRTGSLIPPLRVSQRLDPSSRAWQQAFVSLQPSLGPQEIQSWFLLGILFSIWFYFTPWVEPRVSHTLGECSCIEL